MATVILLRHGRSTGNTAGVLSGRTAGVELDELGREQAAAVGERLAGLPLAAVVSSPLVRCQQTADAVLAHHPELRRGEESGLLECDYGDWQGQPIGTLAKEPLWKVVQRQPSAVTFPGGESMLSMQARMLGALRRWDAMIEAEHGAHAVWVAVSHGDPIKSALADAAGSHLDQFQRIRVDPASVSVIRYSEQRPYLLASNTNGGDLSWIVEAPRAAEAGEESVVGGGAGPDRSPSSQ